jgi:hypothetical protein
MTGVEQPWWRRPTWQGLLGGWLVGMVWWAGLMVAFGPGTVVENPGGVMVERQITVASRLVYAPLVAIPWAFVGLLVGVSNAHYHGYWVTVGAVAGAVVGGVYILETHPFDGWLAWMMPAGCLSGAFAGMCLGVIVSAVLGLSRDPDD